MPRWLYYSLLVLLCWIAFLGINVVQHMLSGFFTWSDSIQMTLSQWLPWTLFLPFISWLVFYYPIERNHWWLRVPVHLAACALTVSVCGWLGDTYFRPPPPLWGHNPRDRDHGEQGPGPGPGPRPNEPGGPRMDWRNPDRRSQTGEIFFRLRFNVPIYLVIASLGHAVAYFHRSQQRGRQALELEALLAEARLQTLRMQIHPHFLFNSLNAISTLVHTNPKAADEMIGSLSELLRLSLASASEQEIPLHRELEVLSHYLEIEKTRFGDRLRVEQSVSPESMNALVPTLILQPLVENAIRHGIEPRLAPGCLKLNVTVLNNRLHIVIQDNGVGWDPAKAARGIGLSNTRARLQTLYPSEHRFEIRNGPEGGCLVEMDLPFHTVPVMTPAKLNA